MQMLTHRADMKITASEKLRPDNRRAQEALLLGALRLRGCRGRVEMTTARIDGVAYLIATTDLAAK